jgi:hypothetical protein
MSVEALRIASFDRLVIVSHDMKQNSWMYRIPIGDSSNRHTQ